MRLHKYRIPNICDIISPAGSPVEPLFTPKFNGSEIVLVESGSIDIQERINSYAPYCDLRYMLNQLKVGDTSVLSPNPPLYGDFSSLPCHPVDALNLITDVEHRFDSLPDEVKQSCNNDWRVYFTRLFTDSHDTVTDVPANLPSTDHLDSDVGGLTDAT